MAFLLASLPLPSLWAMGDGAPTPVDTAIAASAAAGMAAPPASVDDADMIINIVVGAPLPLLLLPPSLTVPRMGRGGSLSLLLTVLIYMVLINMAEQCFDRWAY